MFGSGKEAMPRLIPAAILAVVVISFDILIGSAWAEELVYRTSPMKLSGEVCKPAGKGPFPAVVCTHGGLRDSIGGDPNGTCRALAEAGFVGFSPIRRSRPKMSKHIEDVMAAVDAVKALNFINPDQIALMGFSRGGLLSLMVANRQPDFKALVIMGVAPGRGHLEREMADLSAITAPVLLLVAENDVGSRSTKNNNTVALMRSLDRVLKSADKEVHMIIYPPYPDDGHQLFSTIGTYWNDVIAFLKRRLI